MIDTAPEKIEEGEKELEEHNENMEKVMFNMQFPEKGKKKGIHIENLASNIQNSNSKNEKQIATAEEYKEVTLSLSKNKEYYISQEYDEDGYIEKIIIEESNQTNDKEILLIFKGEEIITSEKFRSTVSSINNMTKYYAAYSYEDGYIKTIKFNLVK